MTAQPVGNPIRHLDIWTPGCHAGPQLQNRNGMRGSDVPHSNRDWPITTGTGTGTGTPSNSSMRCLVLLTRLGDSVITCYALVNCLKPVHAARFGVRTQTPGSKNCKLRNRLGTLRLVPAGGFHLRLVAVRRVQRSDARWTLG